MTITLAAASVLLAAPIIIKRRVVLEFEERATPVTHLYQLYYT